MADKPRILTGLRIAEDLLLKGRRKAESQRRSFANYVETLIAKDLYKSKYELEKGLDVK
jgi:hypothetical protein